MADNIVVVRGLPVACNPMKIRLRFEAECKVRIKDIKVEENSATITLANERDRKIFCENLPGSVKFGNTEHSLTIVEENKPHQSSIVTAPPSPTESADRSDSDVKPEVIWSYKEPQTWCSLESLPACKSGIIVQPASDTISPQDVKKYFENNQLSCGGEIQTMIPMVDGIFIAFRHDTVAEKVWNMRPHRINGKSVVIYLKFVPTAYNERLVVQPLDQALDADEVKDLLLRCSQKNTLMKGVKLSSSGACWVIYDISTEKEEVQDIVQRFRKENRHKISFLLRTDCIQVDNVPKNMSKHEIRMLFENVERTGGGKLTRIDCLNETSSLLYFASYQDVEKLFEKFPDRILPVFGQRMKLYLYFHTLHSGHKKVKKPHPVTEYLATWMKKNGKPHQGERPAEKVVRYKDIDPEIVWYLLEKVEHVLMLNSRLKGLAVALVAQNKREISFKLNDSQKEKFVTSAIEDFVSNYTANKCRVDDDAMKQSIDSRLSSLDSRSKDDVCFRWADQRKKEVIVSGLKAEVESFIANLKHLSNNISSFGLQEEEMRWLIDTKNLDQLKKVYPAILGCTRERIEFSGNSEEVSQAKKVISETLKKLSSKMFIVKEEGVMAFLIEAKQNKKISANVAELMKRENLSATLVVKDGWPYIVGPAEFNNKALDVLKDALAVAESFEISSGKLDSKLPVWRAIEDLESQGKIRIVLKDSTYSIVGFREYLKEAKEKLSQWDIKFQKSIKMENGVAQHIVHFVDDFKKLSAQYAVSHEITAEGIILKGKRESVGTVSAALNMWIKDVVKETLPVQIFGTAEFLKSNEGEELLSKTNRLFQSTVLVAAKPHPPVQKSAGAITPRKTTLAASKSSMTIGPLKISVQQGDITEEKSDAIVNSIGAKFDLIHGTLSRTIATKGGPVIQRELSKCSENDIRLTSSGRLNCKKIFHVAFSHNRKELFESLIKVLQEADKRRCVSISFPAVGTGAGNVSNSTIAELMLKSFREFVNQSPEIKYLRTLNIVLFDKVQLEDFLAELSIADNADSDVDRPRGTIATQPQKQSRSYGVTRDLAEGDQKFLNIGNLTVSVRQGDITEERNHAIVNSTGREFDLSNGMVSKAIIRKGGDAIQKEVRSVKGNHVRVTAAGKLHCIKIIHVVAPGNPNLIGHCISDILTAAEKEYCPTVSIPAIGTGNLKFSVTEVANVMLKAIRDFVRTNPDTKCLKKVDFVIFDKQQVKEFENVFSKNMKGQLPRVSSSPTSTAPTGFTTICVELKVFSFEKDRAKKAVEFLSDEIDKVLVFVIRDDIVNKFTNYEDERLKECGKNYNVRIKRSDGQITVEGLKINSLNAEGRIREIFKVLSLKDSAAESSPYIWEHCDVFGVWRPCDPEISDKIEKGFKRFEKYPSCSFMYLDIGTKQHSVSFTTMMMAGTRIRKTQPSNKTDADKQLQISNNHFGSANNGGDKFSKR